MSKVFIIAEIGINANGDLPTAKSMIDMASLCGCDAVKFQKRTIEKVYTKEYLDSPRETQWGTTQREQKEQYEFSKEDYDEIDHYCKLKGIEWFASAWDEDSQLFLRQYDLKYNKVASAFLTHGPMLSMIAVEKKHTFISTGMSTLHDIDIAVSIFRQNGCPFTLMHCCSAYPTNISDLNLALIDVLRKRYGCEVGYSGHEVSPMPSIMAAVLGATVIERHITLDRTMYGADQAASLELRGLKIMVDNIRNIPIYLGDGVKRVVPGEEIMAEKLRYW
uniref:Putative N-acetylneuraminate synthase n=1 Tax=viral metagenome TaxID=1070528 RepID=A0A6M3JYG8_9ZZZZ